jgi:uncharacterized membrane protein
MIRRRYRSRAVLIGVLLIALTASLMGTPEARRHGIPGSVAAVAVFVVWPLASLVAAVWGAVELVRMRSVIAALSLVVSIALLWVFFVTLGAPN